MLSKQPQTLWSQVTNALGLGEWCVWQKVVRRCVMKRARDLVHLQLNSATQQSLTDISQLVSSIRTSGKWVQCLAECRHHLL
ncbi:hypothetical protein FHG87_020606 [Trinorchestia longiramus]|nr:hypothetical protein FHG87_020606 [Trinorchestia longiramus]